MVDREDLLAFAAPDIARQKLGLEAEQVLVEGELPVVHVERMEVPHIAVPIRVPGLEDDLPLAVRHRDLEEERALGDEARGNVVTVRGVPDLDAEDDASGSDPVTSFPE